MHTRNFNFSKIFTKSLWEKSFEEIVSEGENTMIKVKIAVMKMDEDELPIVIVDRRDVSIRISIRKEERPNFPSPIPLPPYLNLRWPRYGKMDIDEFILYLYLYLYLIGISPGDFPEVLSISIGKRQLLAHEVCLSANANTVEKFININGVPNEH